jgi:hypothetical protein
MGGHRLIVALAAFFLAACATDGSPGSTLSPHPTGSGSLDILRDDARGFTVSLPSAEWMVADRDLTPWLREPAEIFSAGTFVMPVSADPSDGLRPFDAPVAPAALGSMTSHDAFVSVQESSPVGAPGDDRPASFRDAAARRCCSARTGDYPSTWWWIPFIDQGRAFSLFVAIGSDAGTRTEDQAWAVADSLSFEPAA